MAILASISSIYGFSAISSTKGCSAVSLEAGSPSLSDSETCSSSMHPRLSQPCFPAHAHGFSAASSIEGCSAVSSETGSPSLSESESCSSSRLTQPNFAYSAVSGAERCSAVCSALSDSEPCSPPIHLQLSLPRFLAQKAVPMYLVPRGSSAISGSTKEPRSF
jgi:hypothetical protein